MLRNEREIVWTILRLMPTQKALTFGTKDGKIKIKNEERILRREFYISGRKSKN